jgi:hypothetical protein
LFLEISIETKRSCLIEEKTDEEKPSDIVLVKALRTGTFSIPSEFNILRKSFEGNKKRKKEPKQINSTSYQVVSVNILLVQLLVRLLPELLLPSVLVQLGSGLHHHGHYSRLLLK